MRGHYFKDFSKILSICFGVFSVLFSVSVWAVEVKEKPFKATFENQKTEKARLYKEFDYTFIWLTEGRWNKRAQFLLKTLRKAGEEGLNPKKYQKIESVMGKNPETGEAQLKADQEATELLLAYAYDLFKGQFRHLKEIAVTLGPPESFDVVSYLNENFQRDKEGGFLPLMTLPSEPYQRLKKLLAHSRQEQDGVSYPHLSEGDVLKVEDFCGSQASAGGEPLKKVIKILQIQGDLTELPKKSSSLSEDEALIKAVRSFQKRHNLEADGVIGPATLSRLNLSHQDRIDRILLAMEKWRWLPKELGERSILVNIPRFQLTTYVQGKEHFDMNIIIGRQYRKTPTFSSDIYEVRFNPSWHVPERIFHKDKLPKILEDPSYIHRKGFLVYDAVTGQVRDPASVHWGDEDVRLVQPPGDQNALGKIRFTLKTTHDIYLHGTPEKELFKRTKRALSSGCIRVEDPVKLAFFVLHDPEKWPLERIKKEASKTTTFNVPLESSVPVHIIYQTVWVDQAGKAFFFEDVYGRDRVLVEQIKKLQDPGYVVQVDLKAYKAALSDAEEEDVSRRDSSPRQERPSHLSSQLGSPHPYPYQNQEGLPSQNRTPRIILQWSPG